MFLIVLASIVLSQNPGFGDSYLAGAADSGQSQYSVRLYPDTPHITHTSAVLSNIIINYKGFCVDLH